MPQLAQDRLQKETKLEALIKGTPCEEAAWEPPTDQVSNATSSTQNSCGVKAGGHTHKIHMYPVVIQTIGLALNWKQHS